LVVGVLEAERHEHTRRRIWAWQCVSKDVIDLATGDSAIDQCPGSGRAETLAPKLRGDLVADLDGAL
jgi:hypothetical protein